MASRSTDDITINDRFTQCLTLYRNLTFSLIGKGRARPETEDVGQDRLLDEFGRLKIWGEQTKASLPARMRGSLDEFLRSEPKLSEEVNEILLQLETLISSAISINNRPSGPHHDQLSPDEDSSDSLVSDSDYSSQSDADGVEGQDNKPSRPRVSRLSMMLSHIHDHVQLLYHLASLLRRPGLKGRYLRRGNLEESVEVYDLGHIEEKLRSWEREGLEHPGASDDPVITLEEMEMRVTNASSNSHRFVLAKRIAKANMQRREQFKYWAKHPYKRERPQAQIPKLVIPSPAVVQNTPLKQDEVIIAEDNASTVKQQSSKQRSEDTKHTGYTFSTVMTESTNNKQQNDIPPPRTIYAESVVAGKRSTRVPPPPNPKRSTAGLHLQQFECPYCHADLDVGLMRDRQTWKRHVFRDLRPYSCTFPECANPTKLYTTRHDWMYHEMQMHRRQWVCNECDDTFGVRDMFTQHLNNQHPGPWSQHQISVILDMSERPIEESTISPCCFCKSELSLGRLLDHIAGHLEELSLFSLPTFAVEDDDVDSNRVAQAATKKGSNSFDDRSQLSSLNFEDTPLWEREGLGLGSNTSAPLKSAAQEPATTLPSDDLRSGETQKRPIDNAFSRAFDFWQRVAKLQSAEKPSSRGSRAPEGSRLTEALLAGLNAQQDSARPIDVTKYTKSQTLFLKVDQIIDYLTLGHIPPTGISAEDVQGLVTHAIDVLLSQPALLSLKGPIKVFGALEGKKEIVLRYLDGIGEDQSVRYLFLGSYTHERNIRSFEALLLVLAFKVKFPDTVFLLRGQDLLSAEYVPVIGAQVESFFRSMIVRTGMTMDVRLAREIVMPALETCDHCLPIAAIINDNSSHRVFAVHRRLTSDPDLLEQIRDMKRPATISDFWRDHWRGIPAPLRTLLNAELRETLSNECIESLTPYSVSIDASLKAKSYFGPGVILEFLEKNNFKTICTSLEFEVSAAGSLSPGGALYEKYIAVHNATLTFDDRSAYSREEWPTFLLFADDIPPPAPTGAPS